MKLFIPSYCSITSAGVFKDNKEIVQKAVEQKTFQQYAKHIYKSLEVAYPKFHKMDELSKLAFLASEVLLDGDLEERVTGEKTAIILANRTSSLATDRKHHESFRDKDNYFPSPAIFVYTLPNIMLGELCIRHKITGENSCFLMQDLDAQYINDYVHDLFLHEEYEYCITGWVDFQPQDFAAHLLLVSKNDLRNTKQIFDTNFKRLITIDGES